MEVIVEFYNRISVLSKDLERLLNFSLHRKWWVDQRINFPAMSADLLSERLSEYVTVDLIKALVYLLISPRTQSLFELAGIDRPYSLTLALEEGRFDLEASHFNQLAKKIVEFGLLDWFTEVFEEVLKLNSDTKSRRVQIQLALALLRTHKGPPGEVLDILSLIPVHAGGVTISEVGSPKEYPILRSLLLITEAKYYTELEDLIARALVEGSTNSGPISLEIAFGFYLYITAGTKTKFEFSRTIQQANRYGFLGQFVCVTMFHPGQLLSFFDAILSQSVPQLLIDYCEAVALEIVARFRIGGASAVTVYREFLQRIVDQGVAIPRDLVTSIEEVLKIVDDKAKSDQWQQAVINAEADTTLIS